MGFIEIFTLTMIILKLMGLVSISWLAVFMPMIIVAALYLIIFAVVVVYAVRRVKDEREMYKKYTERKT